MRFIVEFFSRKNQHGVRQQNEALLMAVESLGLQLKQERTEHEITREQLRLALEARVEQRHRAVETRGALKVLQGGQARFPLTTGKAQGYTSLTSHFEGANRAHQEFS